MTSGLTGAGIASPPMSPPSSSRLNRHERNEGRMFMATYALVHGAGDVGWYWHLVERELRARGHRTVAPDLPIEDDEASLLDNARVVVEAIGSTHDDGELIVVGQSYGGW